MRIQAQPILIRTTKPDTVRPLLRTAMEWERKSLVHGLNQTRQRLKDFENRYGMTSDDFERRLHAGEIEETPEMTDWRMEIRMVRTLSEQFDAISVAEIAD